MYALDIPSPGSASHLSLYSLINGNISPFSCKSYLSSNVDASTGKQASVSDFSLKNMGEYVDFQPLET